MVLEQKYNEAMLEMVDGSYLEASEMFFSLQGYADAPEMALYCKALDAAAEKRYGVAVETLCSLGDFKDSALLAEYYRALGYEVSEMYSEAISLYASLGLYRDAEERVRICTAARADKLNSSRPVPGETHLYEYQEQTVSEAETGELPVQCGICLNGTEGSKECTMAIVGPKGDLYMWGTNVRYRFGNGTAEPSTSPLWIMDHVSKAIICDGNRTYVLKQDGTLWMCGSGWYEANFDVLSTVKAFTFVMDHVIDVVAGNCYAAVLKDDHSVWIWGNISDITGNLGLGEEEEQRLSLEPQKVMENIKSISGGRWNLAAFDEKQNVYMLGNNEYGELGQYNLVTYYRPVFFMSDVQEVKIGGAHCMVLRNDGSVWTGGYSGTGQLGWGTTNWRNANYMQVARNALAVRPGEFTSFYIDRDHLVYGCGYNNCGQLGLGHFDETTRFQYVTDHAVDVSAAGLSTAILKEDGSIWLAGHISDLMPEITENTAVLVQSCVAYNGYTENRKKNSR
ncbi:MAG: hypothetical protein IJ246_13970 [Clostridia bacterium]|nr:hypothetical protein [Clostridia bacterium]